MSAELIRRSMRHPRSELLRVAAFAWASTLLLATAQGQTTLEFANLRAAIRSEMAANAVPGLAAAAVKDGRILFVEGYGGAGLDQISPKTSFRIASLSKAFTAVAVLQLIEQGRIQLDTPVRTYLQAFTTAAPAQSGQITVRHLLNRRVALPMPDFRKCG